jgi:hypothetical protein
VTISGENAWAPTAFSCRAAPPGRRDEHRQDAARGLDHVEECKVSSVFVPVRRVRLVGLDDYITQRTSGNPLLQFDQHLAAPEHWMHRDWPYGHDTQHWWPPNCMGRASVAGNSAADQLDAEGNAAINADRKSANIERSFDVLQRQVRPETTPATDCFRRLVHVAGGYRRPQGDDSSQAVPIYKVQGANPRKGAQHFLSCLLLHTCVDGRQRSTGRLVPLFIPSPRSPSTSQT